jgi:segregation and condensation protein B
MAEEEIQEAEIIDEEVAAGETDDLVVTHGDDGDTEDLEPVEQLGREETRAVLHALLFVSDKPTSADRLAEALGGVDYDVVRNLLAELRDQLEESDSPYILREIAGGYQFATRSEFAPYIRRMFQIKKRNRLSKAALETLAIIAYKQPCTRADVESIRGVSVSHAFEILREKRLIKVAGVAETVGRPKIYRTTDEFLAHFGIKSLKELPSIQELRETM